MAGSENKAGIFDERGSKTICGTGALGCGSLVRLIYRRNPHIFK